MSSRIGASGAGLVKVVAGGAVIGAGTHVASQTIGGRSITPSGVIFNALFGGVFGGIGAKSSAKIVSELRATQSAFRHTEYFLRNSSGPEINKQQFADIITKKLVTAGALQGARDDIIQIVVEEVFSVVTPVLTTMEEIDAKIESFIRDLIERA